MMVRNYNILIQEGITKPDPLSEAFNEMLEAACHAAASLNQIGIELSQIMFESSVEWIDRLKKVDPNTYENYKDIVAAINHLNQVTAKYESLRKENYDPRSIIVDKRTMENFLDYITMVKKQMTKILTPPENPQTVDILDKIKNSYHEFTDLFTSVILRI